MAEDKESNEGVSHLSEQELVKQFKRRLENWREVLIHLNSLLKWKKPFYPGILAGVVTFIFIILWYFEPSILTSVSVFGIIGCLLDYIVPILSSNFFDSSKWTGSQELKYEEICKSFVHCYKELHSMCHSVQQMKETKPKLYFVGVLGSLIFTAWIGNLINNLFLTYVIVLVLSLLPGIRAQDIVQQKVAQAMSLIASITGQKQKKN